MVKIVALIYAIVSAGVLADEPTTHRTSNLRFDTFEACVAYVESPVFAHVDAPNIIESVIVTADNDFEDEEEFEVVPVCAPADAKASDVRPDGSP